MKEDSRYRNYVNEDGKSWTSFLKQEEQITPRSRKLGRIKTHQRVFIMPEPEPVSLDPDSILINKIIKNIKQEARGKNND